MMRPVINHGDYKTRSVQRVRVQRDRRLSVIGARGGRIRCRRRGVGLLTGRNGLGIAPAGGERAGLLEFEQPNTRRAGKADIVNRRGSQPDAYGNRTATVKGAEARLPGTLLPETSMSCRRTQFCHCSAAQEYNGSPQNARIDLVPGSLAEFPLSVCRGEGAKIGSFFSISLKAWGRGHKHKTGKV